MKLEDLVPPLELCKKIPAGEFADSAFLWLEVENPQENKKVWRIVNRTKPIEYCHNPKFPALTLQEIMVELCNFTPYAVHVCQSFNEWDVGCCIAQEYGERYISADAITNPATAALKLWLKLKGN